MGDNTSITLERAVELCQQYRDKNKVKMFSQCWGCLRFSKGMPEKCAFTNLQLMMDAAKLMGWQENETHA